VPVGDLMAKDVVCERGAGLVQGDPEEQVEEQK